MMSWTAILSLFLFLFSVRLFFVVSYFRRRRLTLPQHTCSIAFFLGSGGHTSEALQLASSLDFSRYTPRTYVVSQGDAFSAQKALALENIKASDAVSSDHHFIQPQYTFLTVPRARRVHQSLLTTPPDAIKSLLVCVYLISICPLFKKGAFRRPFADLLILNGPGTCVILYAAVLLNRLIGLPGPRVIYSIILLIVLWFSGQTLFSLAVAKITVDALYDFYTQFSNYIYEDSIRKYLSMLMFAMPLLL